MQMMRAIHAGDDSAAESIRQWFQPLEDLRNEIHPIRVLHHAVALAGIAETGPLLPMLSDLPSPLVNRIREAVTKMMSIA